LVRLGRQIVGASQQLDVAIGVVAAKGLENVVE
jgi:hypothetical protein